MDSVAYNNKTAERKYYGKLAKKLIYIYVWLNKIWLR
jgi:hypothetical protein